MAAVTGIEWCDHTWSPWKGCTPISAACDHCYAAGYGARFGVPFEHGAPRRRTSADYWKQPARWNRQAAAAGRVATVFPSLCDPFDAEVDPAWLGETLALFEPLGALRLLLLTKRPHLAAKFFAGRAVPANVALGITAESKPMLALRAGQILPIRARWHFLSAEPLLGPLDCTSVFEGGADRDTLKGTLWVPGCGSISSRTIRANRFAWVIAGGESGPKARPSHPDWFRALRDQCAAAGVPFFFKQWGEWCPIYDRDRDNPDWKTCDQVARDTPNGQWMNLAGGQGFHGQRVVRMDRIGKKHAGATLDDREHREVPAW